MILTRLERIFLIFAAVLVMLTLGFGVGVARELSMQHTGSSVAAVERTGGQAVASLPDPAQPDTGSVAPSASNPGTAGGTSSPVGTGAASQAGAAQSQRSGTGATAPGRQAPAGTAVAPTTCPFSSGTLSLGSLVSQSGFFSEVEVANSAKAYFQDLNTHGGVHGCRVNYEVLDDGTNSTLGLAGAKKLVADDHVFAIVSLMAPFSGDTIDPYFNSPGADNGGQPMPVVGSEPYEEIAYRLPNQFPLDLPLYEAGVLMAQQATRTWKISHPSVFGFNVSQLDGAIQGMSDEFKREGLSNVEVVKVDPAASNYTQLAQKLQSDGVDLTDWFCDLGCGERFVKAAQGIGWTPHWVNYVYGYDRGYAQRYGSQGGEEDGALVLSTFMPFEAQTPETSRMYNVTQHYYPGTDADGIMPLGWAGAELFTTEMNRLALTSDVHADQALLIQALSAERSLDLGGLTPPLTFQQGQHSRFPVHLAHRCGQFLTIHNGAMTYTDRSWHCPSM